MKKLPILVKKEEKGFRNVYVQFLLCHPRAVGVHSVVTENISSEMFLQGSTGATKARLKGRFKLPQSVSAVP
jgi:hypothetical protein